MAMWRMNEMWRRMVVALVFCVLLFHSCQAQDVSTVASISSQPQFIAFTDNINDSTKSTDASTTGDQLAQSHSEVSGKVQLNDSTVTPTADPGESQSSNQGTTTVSNQGTKTVIMQNSMTTTDTANDPKMAADMVQSGKKTPTVLISFLLTGLAIAASLIALYVWRSYCRTNAKGVKLADDSYVPDEDNTLVSVAPLNPTDPQEKPSQNGESPEAVKTQTPQAATNGHSTAKTADTEL